MTDRELMQQALDALNRSDYLGWQVNIPIIKALRERLAQPEQEPVAWMHKHIENNVITHRPADLDRHPDRWVALYKTPPPCPTCEALARTVMMDQTSHDTAPRQWQELTDEDIVAVYGDDLKYQDGDYRRYARAIEAKIREKNHG
jgi:hypothetical protein